MFKSNYKDLTLKRILQRGTYENLDDFLCRNIKLSKKKRLLHNTSKRKLSKNNQKSKIITINSMDNLGKKDLSISILTPTLNKNVVDIIKIGADAYDVLVSG